MDLYFPETSEPCPLLIYFHGGSCADFDRRYLDRHPNFYYRTVFIRVYAQTAYRIISETRYAVFFIIGYA